MKELDVRQALHNTDVFRQTREDPTGLIVNELGVMEGKYRVDVAVVTNILHGYEIKSFSDNLDRLPSQQLSYNKVFDKITLVAHEKHVAEAMKIVPQWWGLIVASQVGEETRLEEIWPARQNYAIDPYAVAQLLWREEALKYLTAAGLDRGVRTKARKHLWRRLADEVPLETLREMVREALKSRTEWLVTRNRRRRRRKSRRPRKRQA